jgi:glycosyltransferase involved in cell wall biosynthesis
VALRVAQIIGSLTVGGAERHFVNLLNALPAETKTAILVGAPQAGPSLASGLGADVTQRQVVIRKRSLWRDLRMLAAVLRELQCDVVHTHMFWANLYGSVAARMAGVPVVITTEHGENRWKHGYHRWLERAVISPRTDLRYCVSRSILEQRRDRDGVPASKLRLIGNGTPVPAPRQRSGANTPGLIGAVGRFVRQKNYPLLLDAVAELRRRGYAPRVCLLGDGPEMAALRDRIARLDLEPLVDMPGMDTNTDRWYRRFDYYVSSSDEEGQPVALLEAMSYGLPIVATDVGAISATLADGRDGLVVPRGDAAALADALARFLDDGELADRCGVAARRRVIEEFSIDAIAQKYLAGYRQALAAGGAS